MEHDDAGDSSGYLTDLPSPPSTPVRSSKSLPRLTSSSSLPQEAALHYPNKYYVDALRSGFEEEQRAQGLTLVDENSGKTFHSLVSGLRIEVVQAEEELRRLQGLVQEKEAEESSLDEEADLFKDVEQETDASFKEKHAAIKKEKANGEKDILRQEKRLSRLKEKLASAEERRKSALRKRRVADNDEEEEASSNDEEDVEEEEGQAEENCVFEEVSPRVMSQIQYFREWMLKRETTSSKRKEQAILGAIEKNSSSPVPEKVAHEVASLIGEYASDGENPVPNSAIEDADPLEEPQPFLETSYEAVMSSGASLRASDESLFYQSLPAAAQAALLKGGKPIIQPVEADDCIDAEDDEVPSEVIKEFEAIQEMKLSLLENDLLGVYADDLFENIERKSVKQPVVSRSSSNEDDETDDETPSPTPPETSIWNVFTRKK